MTLRISAAAVAVASTLALAACAPSAGEGTLSSPSSTGAGAENVVTVEDNNGTHTVTSPPTSVVSLDNRTFETLSDWGIELTAAPRALMPPRIAYQSDESIPDIGTHNEPNLETIVAAQPDLILNGQRFTGFFDDIAALAPNAVQLNLEPREGQPFAAELKRQITALGTVFAKHAEAEALNADFDAAIQAVLDSYSPGETVMAVNVSGGNIGYIAPSVGRTLGPVFDIFDLTPALAVDGASDDHQGDDISVEAIAAANPDWILVLDRDAAIRARVENYIPATTVIDSSAALQNVTAVREGHIVYMPEDTYTNESIQTYTEFFQALAAAFAAAR